MFNFFKKKEKKPKPVPVDLNKHYINELVKQVE